jgi:hemoglobin
MAVQSGAARSDCGLSGFAPYDGRALACGRMATLYEHCGGDQGLHRLEEIFYSKVLADPVLQPLFGEGQPHHVEHLTWFTAETFGGPPRFTERLGFQHLVDVHRGLEITDEQRERFIALYLEAADEADLPDDKPFRDALPSHVEFGARVAQQNSQASSDSELYPLDEVPHWEWDEAGSAD